MVADRGVAVPHPPPLTFSLSANVLYVNKASPRCITDKAQGKFSLSVNWAREKGPLSAYWAREKGPLSANSAPSNNFP